ncbi:hypothetical protein B9Z19DRAFT_1064883 [Tuber borchii]|uniref:Uncharacterized protein n=1 Tax=Tuber borchii TaxID=42251 RepID=A0A2T6ZT35_TUBBO|nr:hypothetical protein B9Z19DRAFT_1064883 [Tuber borchii]
MAHIKEEPGAQTHPQLQAPRPALSTQLYSPTSRPPTLIMAHIKEEPEAQTYPQPDSQIAAQGSQNTTTQTTRTKKAPTDPILAMLHQMEETMAAIQRGMEAQLEEQTFFLKQADHLNQQADDLIQEAKRMDMCEQIVDTRSQTLLPRTLDDISPRERNSIARLFNRGANRDNTVLKSLYGVNGQLIPGFPRTLGHAKRLNSEALNPLLLALGLPVSGSVAVRKTRFFNYVGLVYLG